MTDEPAKEQPVQADVISELRNEFAREMQSLRESTEQAIQDKDAEINKLTQENTDLKRSLIRDAIMNGPVEPVEKSPAEIYKETIDKLAGKTLEYMKR